MERSPAELADPLGRFLPCVKGALDLTELRSDHLLYIGVKQARNQLDKDLNKTVGKNDELECIFSGHCVHFYITSDQRIYRKKLDIDEYLFEKSFSFFFKKNTVLLMQDIITCIEKKNIYMYVKGGDSSKHTSSHKMGKIQTTKINRSSS